jgi:hypothetical protein
VIRLRAEGFSPPEISGQDFRTVVGSVLGWQRLRSTAFDLQRTSSGYRFAGRGFGHGVGLCVIGAGTRAARGESVNEILGFYYPGLAVGGLGIAASVPPAGAAERSPAGSPAAEADVRLALPGGEEGEREAIVALVGGARDEIARRAGVVPPRTITLTVHPNVESFTRATGLSWWMSAATRAASIDLLPLTLLRQQGQIERTIRHEVAHVVIDGVLSGRPLWVREGAAMYFADPDDAGIEGRPARVDCPTDAELGRPASAGAQRDAYDRAGRCFRRQLADGRAWTEVR